MAYAYQEVLPLVPANQLNCNFGSVATRPPASGVMTCRANRSSLSRALMVLVGVPCRAEDLEADAQPSWCRLLDQCQKQCAWIAFGKDRQRPAISARRNAEM